MEMSIDASHWPIQGHLNIPWPSPGIPNNIQLFDEAGQWLTFLRQFDLHPEVPLPTATKYLRAQKLYAYGWLEYDFIKAAELVVLSALEGALRDCYGRSAMRVRKKANDRSEPMLAELIAYMVEHDDLDDDVFAFSRRYQLRMVSALYESDANRQARNLAKRASVKNPAIFTPAEPMTLAAIRNGSAHGEPIEGWPWGGLLEIVKDLIEYAYRERLGGLSES